MNEIAIPSLPELDHNAAAATAQRWATRAMPPGALGRLHDIAVRLSAITGASPPDDIENAAVLVFAGDHGVVSDGASAWPSEITSMMVATMADGQAAINQFAAVVGASVTVVDVGVEQAVTHPRVLDHNVRRGTASLARGPAMTNDEALRSVEAGRRCAADVIERGADCLIGGEMGIGNTTAAVAVIAACSGADPRDIVGQGAGLAAELLPHKASLVQRGIDRLDGTGDAMAILREVGGLELGALAGCYLEAAANRVPVLVDGVIALAGLCIADRLCPGVADRCLAGHRSVEPAATTALAHLGLDPLLDLDLRLGEGTGACLALPLVRAAIRAVRDIAELPSA